MSPGKDYLVIDLEMTCWPKKGRPGGIPETIEIGAVVVDGDGLFQKRSFSSFVRPSMNPVLSGFCTSLTSITQSQVDGARGFPEVWGEFVEWVSMSDCLVFSSWGVEDWVQIRRDCEYHGLEAMDMDFLDLKSEFFLNTGLARPIGMERAMGRCGLRFDGTRHRGIDDARNLARMLPYITGTVPLKR